MRTYTYCKIVKFNFFELGIFSFNLYVYYLTRGFIASIRDFNLLTRAFNLPTRAFNLATCAFNLATRAFSLITRKFELVTRGFELVTRGFELVTRNSQLVFYFSTVMRCNNRDDLLHVGFNLKISIFSEAYA